MSDPLGEFLTAYDGYLDGRLDYEDLPRTIYPGVRMSPYRTFNGPLTYDLDAFNSQVARRLSYLEHVARRGTPGWLIAVTVLLIACVTVLGGVAWSDGEQIAALWRRANTFQRAVCAERAP